MNNEIVCEGKMQKQNFCHCIMLCLCVSIKEDKKIVISVQTPDLDNFSVHAEFITRSWDLLFAQRAQAGHAVIPVALQCVQVSVTKLRPVLQLNKHYTFY